MFRRRPRPPHPADLSFQWEVPHRDAAEFLLRYACGSGGDPTGPAWSDPGLILQAATVHALLAIGDTERG